MNVIELKGLTYKYSVGTPFESTAVDNVDLTIEKGEFCGIIGHGKRKINAYPAPERSCKADIG